MIVYVGIALTAVSLWVFLRRGRRNTIPGPAGLPVLGNLSIAKSDKFHQKLEELSKKYGPIFSCDVMGIEVVVLNTPELIRSAFQGPKYGNVFNDRPESFIGKYLATGYSGILFGRYSEATFKQQEAFHRCLNLAGDGAKAVEHSVHRELERLVDTLTKATGQDVDPAPLIERSMGNLATVLMLGEPMADSDYDVVRRLALSVNKCLVPGFEFVMYKLPSLRFLSGYFGGLYRQTASVAGTFMRRYFTEHKATHKPEVQRGLLDAFLKLQNDEKYADETWFTDEQIKGLVQSIVAIVVITGSNGLLAALLVLLHHPAALDKIYKEVLRVSGTGRLPRLQDKARMPYTQAAMFECLRFANIVPFLHIHSSRQDTVFEGHMINRGARILPNIWSINRDPKIWDEPNAFRPERFLTAIGRLVPADHVTRQSLLVFGVGKRSCTGEELAMSVLFLYITTLVQKFRLSPPESTSLPAADSRGLTTAFVMIPPAYKLRAVSRTQTTAWPNSIRAAT